MKKNLIIFFSKLSVGGMEKALVEFIKMSDLRNNYHVTLYVGYVIEKKYLEEIQKYIDVQVIWKHKWNLLGKTFSFFRILKDCFFMHNKFDCAICYTHHHQILAKLTRSASKNNIVFIHSDLNKIPNSRELMNKVKYDKFAKVVCVSNCAKASFLENYPHYSGKIIVANNYLDGKTIIEKGNEEVLDIKFDKITFVNVARQLEDVKKISRIINATSKLVKENYQFQVILIGDGINHNDYIMMVKELGLDDTIYFTGSVLNPYKYVKRSDALILSSLYEGYGIVLDESRILGVPIISTNVGDAALITKDGYGILCDNSSDGVYVGMKKFLDKKYQTKSFAYQKFNDNITKKINDIVLEK